MPRAHLDIGEDGLHIMSMKHVWQIIDVFASFGNTVLTVWDAEKHQRKTLKLNGHYDFRVGQMLAWQMMPGNHVSLDPLGGDVALTARNQAIIPINREITVLQPVSI
jgi:hypothetical protein